MIYFTWTVAKRGYRWVQDGGEMYLQEVPGSLEVRSYRPLEECPELFTVFAKLKTPEEILDFANQYGLPWTPLDSLPGVSLRVIEESIDMLRAAVEVWECLQRGHKHRLGLKIAWQGNKVVYDPGGEAITIADGEELYPHIFATWRKGDVVGPAKLFLAQQANKNLRGTVEIRLVINEAGEFESNFAPSDLWGAFWLQLLWAATGVKRFIECAICGGWMEITSQNRKTKKAHDKCRKRVWAQKQKVRSLSQEGRTVQEIASATGLEEAKIRAWLKEGKSNAKKST